MDRKLQRHRADSLRQHGFLVYIYFSFARIDTVFASDDVFRWGLISYGGLIVMVKIFPPPEPPKPQIFSPFLDRNFRPQRFTMGTLQSKLPLIIIVALESCIVNRQIGVKVSKFLVVTGLHVT